MKLGYFLSSEEWGPCELLAQARMAHEAGFDRLWISDHYHPWNDEQGHSPFVWSTIGAIAAAVPGMTVTTAVTCPTLLRNVLGVNTGIPSFRAASSTGVGCNCSPRRPPGFGARV